MDNQIFIGDCRVIMRDLVAQGVKVQMCVTSPPYWGLRDYGVEGQLGLEKTPEEYVSNMVEVFRLVRELLADDGVLWLNLGDSYHNGDKGGYSKDRVKAEDSLQKSNLGANFIGAPNRMPHKWLKPKDLVGIPWRVAFALQADGWWLRQDIIWSKPNPMPESVTDRCTKSHEYLFLLSKRERYYYDQAAIMAPVTQSSIERLSQPTLNDQHGSDRVPGKTNGPMKAVARTSWHGSTFDDGKTGEMMKTRWHRQRKDFDPSQGGGGTSFNGHSGYFKKNGEPICGLNRNKRSVWTVATQPYAEAHFATFPPALIEPCILAGSRPGDIVFDPFMGSGTTAQVAEALGREWLGCELNADYAPMQQARTRQRGLILDHPPQNTPG